MREMVYSIFGNLNRHDRAIKNIVKCIDRQRTCNAFVYIGLIAVGISTSSIWDLLKSQNEEVEALKKEISEMKANYNEQEGE